MRVNLEKSKVKTIKEKKEQNLRDLAMKAREERAGIRREEPVAGAGKFGRVHFSFKFFTFCQHFIYSTVMKKKSVDK